MNTAIDVNDLIEIREAGLRALGEALGPAGMVRFMQQYENGYGDYTKEKQQQPDWTVEEIDALLNNGQR
jgi:hypothetical protein